MAKIPLLSDGWTTIKEIDLKPIQQQAVNGARLAIVGRPGSGRSTLAAQMRTDPNRPTTVFDSPVIILDIDHEISSIEADLIILMVDSRDSETALHQKLVTEWANTGKKTLVFINQFETQDDTISISSWTRNRSRRVVWGPVTDHIFLLREFIPAVMALLPDKLLGLGRYFPLFRAPIAQFLINDACTTNAAYALSTGLAETVGVFNLPITVADMVVLTKNQAYLVYKLGLALGYTTRWQDYVAEFGSVLGSGFLWRQLARSLVGLIPVWGILPKVAVSYAGTFVVGHAVLQWYLTGRHVSKKQMQQLYSQAFAKGKNFAQNLTQKLPKPRISKPRLAKPRQKLLPAPGKKQKKVCLYCGKTLSDNGGFCPHCGMPVTENEIS